jgi:hypothetical protein
VEIADAQGSDLGAAKADLEADGQDRPVAQAGDAVGKRGVEQAVATSPSLHTFIGQVKRMLLGTYRAVFRQASGPVRRRVCLPGQSPVARSQPLRSTP